MCAAFDMRMDKSSPFLTTQKRRNGSSARPGLPRASGEAAHGTTSMVVTVLDFDVKVGLCDFIYRDLYVYIYNMCVCLKKA